MGLRKSTPEHCAMRGFTLGRPLCAALYMASSSSGVMAVSVVASIFSSLERVTDVADDDTSVAGTDVAQALSANATNDATMHKRTRPATYRDEGALMNVSDRLMPVL